MDGFEPRRLIVKCVLHRETLGRLFLRVQVVRSIATRQPILKKEAQLDRFSLIRETRLSCVR